MPTAGNRVLTSSGKRAVRADGKRLLFAAGGSCPECCEEFDCCRRGTCCFSTDSTVSFSFNLTDISFSAGESFAMSSGSGTLPYSFCNDGIQTIGWHEGEGFEAPVGEYRAIYSESGDTWNLFNDAIFHSEADESSFTELYYVEALSSDGDCCGQNESEASITISKYVRDTPEDEWSGVGTKIGTGSLVITVQNNGCCFVDGIVGCQKTSGNCDGTCDEEPP